jgi:hypothetical protein
VALEWPSSCYQSHNKTMPDLVIQHEKRKKMEKISDASRKTIKAVCNKYVGSVMIIFFFFFNFWKLTIDFSSSTFSGHSVTYLKHSFLEVYFFI